MQNNYQDEIAKILIDIESVKFSFDNPFTLTSGLKSPVYVDCRRIISFTKERNKILNYIENYFVKNNITFELINAMRKSKLKVSDIFVIFYYDIFDLEKTPLALLDVKIHYLCTWKNIFNVIIKNNILSSEKLESLKFFLKEPDKWRQINK